MSLVDEAFKVVRREDFLPDDLQDEAIIDAPLPIGFGQTNSQPSTVRMMLDWLKVEPGNKILDVGSGSGWTTALLAYLTGPKGKVYAVEKVPELVGFGRQNCQKAGVKNAVFYKAGSVVGLPKFAPYDRILVSAAAKEIPEELLDQLIIGGRMVVPVVNSIFIINKVGNKDYEIAEKFGFAFVPLIT
ncbi:protein-L-isoaspartate O-methyltransferase [Candidatus Saccharibacteria bacterium]|nr:protein-L-isoaspartate O-methyltransferase [Candidatus Saccharibacteria bacterium]